MKSALGCGEIGGWEVWKEISFLITPNSCYINFQPWAKRCICTRQQKLALISGMSVARDLVLSTTENAIIDNQDILREIIH